MLNGFLAQNELNYKTNPARKSKSNDRSSGWGTKQYREAFPQLTEPSKPHEILSMEKDFDSNMIQTLFPDRAIKAQNFIDLLACNRKNDKQHPLRVLNPL